MYKPRPMQEKVLEYSSGWMGIAAVPGSGKTHTLSSLAAQLITRGLINDEQEILIVTLVNSAVDNFSTRVASFIHEAGLLENVGYRVRTLHGLAHDIVREKPELAGLSEQFSIIDEAEAAFMVEQYTSQYLREHSELASLFVDSSIDLYSDSKTMKAWIETITTMNSNFISQAKDLLAEPQDILRQADFYKYKDPLLYMALEVYNQYQAGLRYRSAVDFSDLIRLAHGVLSSDPQFLQRLQYRWPYILEDEAQDSSTLQEKILRLLVGPNGNWVRVGDTNQAIYETFTTASPKFLRDFLKEKKVISRELANSGRSNLSIINLANSLNEWVQKSHPVKELRDSLADPKILPSPPGDPQPNPTDNPNSIYIKNAPNDSADEIKKVVSSIKNWLPNHQDKTVAVLCPIGWYGENIVEALQVVDIPVVELLKSTQSTRRVTHVLEKILYSLADPASSPKISQVFDLVLKLDDRFENLGVEVNAVKSQLKGIRQLEDYLYPIDQDSWKNQLDLDSIPQELLPEISRIREYLIHWQSATLLPIDQLLITIGNDLFSQPQDLALTHKLALLLEITTRTHPEYRLTQFADELARITKNDRGFTGFSEDDNGFNPEAHKGEVLVSTFHKAKGLEWDRVYLVSVNNYDFPSAQDFDNYKGEKWFIRNQLNLDAELNSKLKGLLEGNETKIFQPEGAATIQSRLDYSAERLRLLYVGITRAKENLSITWNTGTRKDRRMALPLEALSAIVEKHNADS
jgi:DNA helicase II / ATP-dependent DNA helicase PcrA